MLKKLILPILILIIFLLPSLCFSGALEMDEAVIARKNAGGVNYEWLGQLSVAGADTTTAQFGFNRASASFTPSHIGTISKIAIYSSNTQAAQDVEIVLYTDNGSHTPNTKVGTEYIEGTMGTWSLGWKEFTVDWAVTVQKYWIAVSWADTDAGTVEYYIAATGDGNSRDNETWSTWNATWQEDGTGTGNFCWKAYNSW